MRAADPQLAEGYRQCARLTWRFGTTYFWGAVLLAPARRHHVYAVYALCRLADDIVDDQEAIDAGATDRTAAALAGFAERFRTALSQGTSTDPVLAAVVHTVAEVGIDPECFERFFAAMTMDLTVTSYLTWADLCAYMEGSAAVIGEMMLPVLQPISPAAREPARSLGLAFQLTNFLRDIGEDLDRGRIYLPQEDLERFRVDLSAGRPVLDETWRALMAFELERNRALYRQADPGIALLPSRSARCVATARVLYSQILDRIERAGFDVFSERIRVPTTRKFATATRIALTGPPSLGDPGRSRTRFPIREPGRP